MIDNLLGISFNMRSFQFSKVPITETRLPKNYKMIQLRLNYKILVGDHPDIIMGSVPAKDVR